MFLFSLLSVAAGLLPAEPSDTLQPVTVVADRGVVVSRTDTIQTKHSISITDAFSSIPGMYVCDYGGLAGLKNVSLRSLGSPHAAIYFDGVRVGNVQTGQADLVFLDFGNCGSTVIDYAQNSISFNTARPVFGNRNVGGNVKFRGGSFGTFEPSGRLNFRLSDKVSLSAIASGVLSRGDFPLQDGTSRTNNDIRQLRAALDLWGLMDGGDYHAKAYYNGSKRGTPGSLDWPSSDRQNDRNAFIQAVLRRQVSPLYHLTASAKVSLDDLLYLSEWGDNRYKQTEAQINSSHKFTVCDWFDASLAADFQWDGLDSDLYSNARSSVFATVSAAFHPDRFKADLALEYAGVFDRDGQKRHILSPSADLRWNVFKGFDILAFARRAYRTPTFNELYYPGYGNPDLQAEDAWLTDVGVEYHCSPGKHLQIQAKADAFFNHLKNKIVSAPTEIDPNIWLPYNIGIVQMSGADTRAELQYSQGDWKSSFSVRYSYQNAIDKTPDSYSFGQQIPYISKHTVSLGTDASYKGWFAAVKWNWRGDRYDSVERMPDYNTLDFNAGKDFKLPNGLVLGIEFIARNLADCRYELAGGYPMPGRAFYGGINFKF